jgi:hypothetical protein
MLVCKSGNIFDKYSEKWLANLASSIGCTGSKYKNYKSVNCVLEG